MRPNELQLNELEVQSPLAPLVHATWCKKLPSRQAVLVQYKYLRWLSRDEYVVREFVTLNGMQLLREHRLIGQPIFLALNVLARCVPPCNQREDHQIP